MRIKLSKNVPDSVIAPIAFAFQFAQARAKSLGKRFNPSIQVTACRLWDRGYRGRASRGRNRVLLRFARRLPAHTHKYARYANMPCFDLAGGSESVVYLAAHEFGHIIGYPGDKTGEIAACKFGYAAVEAYREQQYLSPACLI